MGGPFIGSEALATGKMTRHQLRRAYTAVHPDVYVPAGTRLCATTRAAAAWLWSGRSGVVAGRSASALHGAKWVDDDAPAPLLHRNRRPPNGIETWSDRYEGDEVQTIRGMAVTTPERTALDLACRLPFDDAVAAIDALARATRIDMADVDLLARRYRGRRVIRRARQVLELVDAGAESPQETRLRLLYIRAGFPRPETQIPVCDEYGQLVAVLDMGWRDVMVGVDYEGEHHRLSRRQFNRDIRRFDQVTELGWTDVRVTVEDPDAVIIDRTRRAFERRGVSVNAPGEVATPRRRSPEARSATGRADRVCAGRRRRAGERW
ncbi:MAG: hypothetical protein JWR11_2673 [Mycobacterium sp.]|jgi:hypothetical protein|nr:hypothetical protein [Mycobacterium sp.]MDT5177517.1 hypothetical protein [Mycobacterium sp.]